MAEMNGRSTSPPASSTTQAATTSASPRRAHSCSTLCRGVKSQGALLSMARCRRSAGGPQVPAEQAAVVLEHVGEAKPGHRAVSGGPGGWGKGPARHSPLEPRAESQAQVIEKAGLGDLPEQRWAALEEDVTVAAA